MVELSTVPAKRRRKPRPESIPDTPDPIEIAMVAAASGRPLPDIARHVLQEQANLIRAQCSELRLRRIGEGVRAALWAQSRHLNQVCRPRIDSAHVRA
jgi:hypothetical protein